MIRKADGGYVITHCSGGKGRIPATKHPVSKRKAQSIHGAIMWRKVAEKHVRG